MILSSRVKDVSNSITLKLNEKANKLSDSGRHVYNLTSGQLHFKPNPDFIESLSHQLNFLKSYQYSPIAGMRQLRDKLVRHCEDARDIQFDKLENKFDCIVSNGAKHSIYNVLGAILDPGDEVILLTPYWVSYPEMIKFWGGVSVPVRSESYDGFIPHIEEIKKVISERTKAVIINSPNNPAGINYSKAWMSQFAELMGEYEDVILISDEIYHELNYFDPKPVYFYQENSELLNRTVIIDGISKSFACTGLRVGYCIADEKLIKAMEKIQGQTTSGPNSLVQRALIDFDFTKLDDLLNPVKVHIRKNSQIMRELFRTSDLSNCWYQTMSAFYFMLDFSRTPMFTKFKEEEQGDYSQVICDGILEEKGVVMVPGSDFGCANSARISMVLEEAPFEEAIKRLIDYLTTIKE